MIKISVKTFHNCNLKLLGIGQQKTFDNYDQALEYYNYLLSLWEDPVWDPNWEPQND
jgi:hypothetical protein